MDNEVKFTDEELLRELSTRFAQNQEMLKELEELNKKLIDSEMMKSYFLSNIKNEIVNPISAILGLSLGLINNENDQQMVARSINLIYEEAFNLGFQLRNIFAAAKIEAGETNLEMSIVEISSLIESLCDSHKFLADKKKLTIKTSIPPKLSFKTDSNKLSSVFTNLLSNAIKFSKENDIINIQVTTNEDKELSISIQDNGIGINEEDQHTIFDRFKQLDSGTTKQFIGHGLGLSIASSYLDSLGGSIAFDCEIDNGCCFNVMIPEGQEDAFQYSYSENSFFFDSNGEIF